MTDNLWQPKRKVKECLFTPDYIPDIVLECDHSEPCWKPCVCEQEPCEHCFLLFGGCYNFIGWIEEREE